MIKELFKFAFMYGAKAICGLVVFVTGVNMLIADQAFLNYMGGLVIVAYLINVNLFND